MQFSTHCAIRLSWYGNKIIRLKTTNKGLNHPENQLTLGFNPTRCLRCIWYPLHIKITILYLFIKKIKFYYIKGVWHANFQHLTSVYLIPGSYLEVPVPVKTADCCISLPMLWTRCATTLHITQHYRFVFICWAIISLFKGDEYRKRKISKISSWTYILNHVIVPSSQTFQILL